MPTPCMERSCSLTAVSYTHLDVYKRQALGFELMCRCPELHFVHPGFIPDVEGLMKEAVEAYEKGYLPQGGLITHRFGAEEMHKAYELMLNEDTEYLKGAVLFE